MPPDKVLFVGDIFGWGLIPCGAVTAKSAKLLDDTYSRLIEFGATTVVPGHGPICGTAELSRWVEYFHWLIDEVSAARQAGKSDAEMSVQLGPPDDMTGWWRFVQWKHGDSLDKVIRAVSKGEW